MKLIVPVLGFLCFLTIFSTAQQAKVNLSFVSFPKAHTVEPVELLIGREKTVEVSLPSHTISAPVRIPQLKQWLLGKSGTDEKGNFTFEVFGKVEASTSPNQTLVVFRSKQDDKPKFKVVRIDGDVAGAEKGSQFFHNATKVPIGVIVGDQKFALEPGQHKLTRAKASYKRDDREYLGVEYYYKVKNRDEKFDSTTWRHNDKVRHMVFFYHHNKTMQISSHMLRSYPKPPKEIPSE